MGFVQGLSTQSALGVITSYSTITSTSYLILGDRGTTSTRYVTTSATTLAQQKLEGPHVKIEGGYSYLYPPGGGVIQDVNMDGKIWNLMTVPIEKGEIQFLVSNKAGTVTQKIAFAFPEIKVGYYIVLQGKVSLTRPFSHDDVEMNLLNVILVCKGVVTQVPVATYTFAGFQTYTYVMTYTTAFTLSESQSPVGPVGDSEFASGILTFTVLMIMVLVVVTLVANKMLEPAKEKEAAAESAMKACVKCGSRLPTDAEYCDECGARQTQEV
jgi:ribosomal protein L40E